MEAKEHTGEFVFSLADFKRIYLISAGSYRYIVSLPLGKAVKAAVGWLPCEQ